MQRQAGRYILIAVTLLAGLCSARGFALLGPFAPWMTEQFLYQDGGYTIGGPMNIGEGYRWNVPVVTYGFDQSFLNYFGSNGVAALQSAVQILNDLPPASVRGFTNYPDVALGANPGASGVISGETQSIFDVKSQVLCLLVEHMGLAQPQRSTCCLTSYTDPFDYDYTIRNFDSLTLASSPYVNGTLYSCAPGPYGRLPGAVYANVYTADPTAYANGRTFAVADGTAFLAEPGVYNTQLQPGFFWTNLTSDDVGGLSYLLSSTNFALESLIPGVTGVGANVSNYVNTALRPGVDKITFVPMQFDSTNGKFFSITNQYVDSYVTNGSVRQQTLQRVITQPDILFTVQNLFPLYNSHYQPLYTRTDTSSWINNGDPFQDGPGVIQPPVVIAFDMLGPSLLHYSSNYSTNYIYNQQVLWGSFDGTTNAPVIYPIPAPASSTIFRLALSPNYFCSWSLSGNPNQLFLLQTSTDLQSWINITSITNLGGTYSYADLVQGNSAIRYFRTVPQ